MTSTSNDAECRRKITKSAHGTSNEKIPSATFFIGALIRAAILIPLTLNDAFRESLGNQPELSTSFSSISSAREGAFLCKVNRSQFEGNMFFGAPLMLDILYPVLGNPFSEHLFFFVLDLAIAAVIWRSTISMQFMDYGEDNDFVELDMLRRTKVDKETKKNNWGNFDFFNSLPLSLIESNGGQSKLWLSRQNMAEFACLVYLVNPFTLLSSASGNMNAISFFFALVALSTAMEGRIIFSGLAIATAASLDISHALLLVPIAMSITKYHHGETSVFHILKLCVTSTAFWVSLLFLNLQRGNVSFTELFRRCYFVQFELPDLSPNIGLWWYFFIEVFPESYSFFLFVLPLFVVVCGYIPLCLKLWEWPQTLGHALIVMYYIFRPYPDVFGLGLLAVFICMHPLTAWRMRNLPILITGIVVPLSLLPLMRYMWLIVGTANANYYYFQTLILNFCLFSTFLSFLDATALRDAHVHSFRKLQITKDDVKVQ